ncbi:MAG TPA: hypothetical protein VMR70_21365 [Flavisolibacter sp.]|nr:hypothetical protein [Flavisolibacter sp.]
MKNTVIVKPYTVLELARLYGISDRTMKKWLVPFEAEIGSKVGYFYTIAQVQIIFQKLGTPGESIE